MWAETVWALTYAMLAILRQHVIWLAATSEMSSRLLHTVVFTPSIANSTWMDSWEKKQRSNLMKYQQARATWMKEEQENQESLSHIRAAVLTLLQENTSEKDQKSERDLYGRTSWWTMFIHWWEQRQNHLNHLPPVSVLPLHGNRWAWADGPDSIPQRKQQVQAEQPVVLRDNVLFCFFFNTKAEVEMDPSQVRVKPQSAFQLKYYSATRYVWAESDLSWQPESWRRPEDLRPIWGHLLFFSVWADSCVSSSSINAVNLLFNDTRFQFMI